MEQKNEDMNKEKNKLVKKILNLLFGFVAICGALVTLVKLAELRYFNAFGGLFEIIIAFVVAIIVFVVLNSFRKKIIKKVVGE